MANLSTTQRMKNYRERLRKEGLRPVQIWTVDQKNPKFKSELKRQVGNLSASSEEKELEFWEQVADWPKE
jgi:hypothetical protein